MRKDWEVFLSDQATLSEPDMVMLRALDPDLHPLRMLQSLIPVLHISEVKFGALSSEAARGLAIIARLPTLIATYRQLQLGREMPAFVEKTDYLTDFMRLFTLAEVNAEHVEILKVVQILQMEHSFNAGTFASRVTSSTLAPIESVFSAAAGALFGILHGGADESALNDARRVGGPSKARQFVVELLKSKSMLMGHREYRTVDPRSIILKPKAEHQSVRHVPSRRLAGALH